MVAHLSDDETPIGDGCVIGVGASAGGVEALQAFVRALPARLEATVLVVLHVSPSSTSVLAQILDRAGPLPASPAEDGQPARKGHIHVAPPDRHLLIDAEGIMRLSAGPRENGHRPAIDALFRSVATHGPRGVAVVLSGTRDDGTAGLVDVVAAGGTALLQDPAEAAYDGMIRSAAAHVAVHATAPVAELAHHLATITNTARTMTDPEELARRSETATSTRYTCPDCGGHLTRRAVSGLVRYTCEVGHAYAPTSLDDEQGAALERALWQATRLLGDRSSLLTELAVRADDAGHERSASDFRSKAREAQDAQDVVRALLVDGRVPIAGQDLQGA